MQTNGPHRPRTHGPHPLYHQSCRISLCLLVYPEVSSHFFLQVLRGQADQDHQEAPEDLQEVPEDPQEALEKHQRRRSVSKPLLESPRFSSQLRLSHAPSLSRPVRIHCPAPAHTPALTRVIMSLEQKSQHCKPEEGLEVQEEALGLVSAQAAATEEQEAASSSSPLVPGTLGRPWESERWRLRSTEGGAQPCQDRGEEEEGGLSVPWSPDQRGPWPWEVQYTVATCSPCLQHLLGDREERAVVRAMVTQVNRGSSPRIRRPQCVPHS